MPIVLALDPGLSTGWAAFTYDHETPATLVGQGVIPDGVEGYMRATAEPALFHHWNWVSLVTVYEDFVIDGTITGSWASETIGAMKMYQWEKGTAPLVKQTRMDKASLFGHKAKTTQKRETERFNWLRARGFDGVSHELDAITHALVYIKRQDHVPTIRKYWTDFNGTA